jgi:nitroreductase
MSERPSQEGQFAQMPLPLDQVGLLEGMATTRTIRRYTEDPVPSEVLRAMLFAATRAPSGSNRQPFRFMVLTESPKAVAAKQIVARGARQIWEAKRVADGYDRGTGTDSSSPKARVALSMQHYVDHFEEVPVLVLPCLVRHRAPFPTEGASVYPACQNLLLAARALGYGGAFTVMHYPVESELRELLDIPEEVFLAGTITIGKPAGGHGPVRRRPLSEFVYSEGWGVTPDWAVDPPGTRHTSAGPPKEATQGQADPPAHADGAARR